MTCEDAIGYVEEQFTCEMGAPTKWADLGMTKPYQLITVCRESQDRTDYPLETVLAARIMRRFQMLKDSGGFLPEQKPKLYWRWAQKIRFDGQDMEARVYLDGHPDYRPGNPSRPKGRPIGGQYRLAAGTDTEAVAA